MEKKKRLPLGVQDFSILRDDDYLYVDKTDLIYDLVHNNRAVFLSRPRRFGKSLLLSTIKYYFLGKKELFRGLAIEKLEEASKEPWAEYPVFYLSFIGDFTKTSGLTDLLKYSIFDFEKNYELPHIDFDENDLTSCFGNLFENTYKITGHKIVILVDEYDIPLLRVMRKNSEQMNINTNVCTSLYRALNDYKKYIHFCIITGYTNFTKSILLKNIEQLEDISFSEKFASICGINEQELKKYYTYYIHNLTHGYETNEKEIYAKLKTTYGGFHFGKNNKEIYNPDSLNRAFDENDIEYYWFEHSTPTFLIDTLKSAHFSIQKDFQTIEIIESELYNNELYSENLYSLLYQSGYLTIKSYNSQHQSYILGLPNKDVEYSFFKSLPNYL